MPAMPTTSTNASAATRVLTMTRASTSRPYASVPSRCDSDGRRQGARQVHGVQRSGDETTEAPTVAESTTTPTRTQATGLRLHRNATTPGPLARLADRALANLTNCPRSRGEAHSCLTPPDSRVDDTVNEVYDEVNDNVTGADNEDHALHDGIVTSSIRH